MQNTFLNKPIPAKRNAVNSLVGGLNDVAQSGIQNYQKSQYNEQQAKALQSLGLSPEVSVAAIGNPKIMESLIEGNIKQKGEEAKRSTDLYEDDKNYGQIANTFGEKFAKIWRAAPTGGRTELLKQGLDAKLRGNDLEQMLSNIPDEALDMLDQMPRQEMKASTKSEQAEENLPPGFEWPDFTKAPPGYTPKDWIKSKGEWRKENAPIFEESKTKLKNAKRDQLGVKNLTRLNNTRKIGEGFEGALINPTTGEFYGPAQAAGLVSKEGQEWVKEIARFQNRAKDAFGSRVTNFDLQSYMKQFPGLLNTYEGRKRILDMMDTNYKLDSLYENALQKVYQKYKLNGVPQEDADALAQQLIAGEAEKLESKYLGLDEQNKMQSSQIEKDLTAEFPPPDQHSGRKIVDEETGAVYQSNGKEWRKVK